MAEREYTRDDHGRFSSGGLSAWAKQNADKGDSPGKVIAEAKAPAEKPKEKEPRKWTDELPKGMQDQTWKGHYDGHPDAEQNPAGVAGKPNAERAALHEKIMSQYTKATPAAQGEQKIAIMTMGAPASGKSSALRGIDESKFVKSDPDEIKGHLPEYQKAIDPKNTYRGAAAMAHEESSAVAKEITKRAIENGQHVIVDGTGAKVDSFVKKMNVLKKNGYQVHVAMPHIEYEEGAKRMAARAESTGRYVPPNFVQKAYQDIPKNVGAIARAADSFKLYDNSVKGGRLVYEKTVEGKHVDHDPAYMKAFRDKHGW